MNTPDDLRGLIKYCVAGSGLYRKGPKPTTPFAIFETTGGEINGRTIEYLSDAPPQLRELLDRLNSTAADWTPAELRAIVLTLCDPSVDVLDMATRKAFRPRPVDARGLAGQWIGDEHLNSAAPNFATILRDINPARQLTTKEQAAVDAEAEADRVSAERDAADDLQIEEAIGAFEESKNKKMLARYRLLHLHHAIAILNNHPQLVRKLGADYALQDVAGAGAGENY